MITEANDNIISFAYNIMQFIGIHLGLHNYLSLHVRL